MLLNMVYADILSLMDGASLIRRIMAGASMPVGGLLAGADLMETGIAMVIVSRMAPWPAVRWANIVVAAGNSVAVATGGTLSPYYVFFATMEVVGLALCIGSAWTWTDTRAGALEGGASS